MVKNVGDLGLIPRSGRSPGEGNGNPHQYSCLENSTDRGAWWATVHGVAKSRTQLSIQLPTLSTCHVPSSFIYSYHPHHIQWHSFWEAIESLCNWTTWFEYYGPCHLQAVWLWAKYLTSLCFSWYIPKTVSVNTKCLLHATPCLISSISSAKHLYETDMKGIHFYFKQMRKLGIPWRASG